ncbi:MAG TPA: hypothetical protein VGS22_02555 [Thermoanaerobaculia bacterium]|jgi:hypothetical protein|nr:hypothetical protein [Thermoanaerobaculia bacterium]
MKSAGWKYSWLTYRRDALWFPPAFLALFFVILGIMNHPAVRFTIARAYLGFILPLIGGILAAYAVLDDPALELRFSTPVRAERTLLSRLGLILAVETACALVFQLFTLALSVDLAPLGGLLGVQLMWILPTLSLIALATAGSLAGAQPVTGAFLVGGVWLVQLMMKGWFELNARHLFLFMGVFTPHHPDLIANRCVLLAGSLSLLGFSWVLLHRQERFI